MFKNLLRSKKETKKQEMETTNENSQFDFTDWLINEKEWTENSKGFSKASKSIRFIAGGKFLLVMNMNKKVKHKHIVTCLVPETESEAELLFKLCMLNPPTDYKNS